jgi:hypothetical protein
MGVVLPVGEIGEGETEEAADENVMPMIFSVQIRV